MPKFNEITKKLPSAENTDNLGEVQKVLMRDPRTATRVFGTKDPELVRVPRHRYLFFVNFLRPDGKNYGDWRTGISLLVKDITRPNINFETERLNQYNKWRIVQKKISFNSVTITLWDTYDSRVLEMFREYYYFYYGEGRANVNSWAYDITMPEIANNPEIGFSPPGGQPEFSYFFERIEVYEFGNGKYNKYSYIHPKITSISFGTNDYQDTSTPQTIDITFDYEGLVFEIVNEPLKNADAESYGLNLSDVLNIKLSRPLSAGMPNQEAERNAQGVEEPSTSTIAPEKLTEEDIKAAKEGISKVESVIGRKLTSQELVFAQDGKTPVKYRFDALPLEDQKKLVEYEERQLFNAEMTVKKLEKEALQKGDTKLLEEVNQKKKALEQLKVKVKANRRKFEQNVITQRSVGTKPTTTQRIESILKKPFELRDRIEQKIYYFDALMQSKTSEIGRIINYIPRQVNITKRKIDQLKKLFNPKRFGF